MIARFTGFLQGEQELRVPTELTRAVHELTKEVTASSSFRGGLNPKRWPEGVCVLEADSALKAPS